MRIFGLISIFILSFVLSACGTLSRFSQDESYGVAAARLDVDVPDKNGNLIEPPTDPNQAKPFVWKIVNNSEHNCNAFMNGLVAAETGTGTLLDMSTTTFSALATAFSPLSTVHALAAGSAITGGWRTAIDSDVFAKSSIGNYAQAIQATYYKSMADYVAKLEAATTVDPGAEEAKIRSIHSQCSLAAAQSTITATLQASQKSQPAMTGWTLTASPAATAQKITLTAKWTDPQNKATLSIDVPVTAAKGANAITIASGLKDAVNNQPALRIANISAFESGNPPNGAITLQGPAADNITWSVTPNGTPVTLSVGTPILNMVTAPTPTPQTTIVPPGQAVQNY